MEEASSKPSRWRTEWIVAISAIVVSIATLFVYIYQARIMQSQQHASVWPYVEWTMTYSTIDGIYLSVQNKGVGPALIKNTELSLDGKAMSDPRALLREITQNKSDSMWLFTAAVRNRVLAPGEEIRLFHIKGEELLAINLQNLNERIKYKICYCSIYDDCWTSSGLEVTKGDCK